jgi:hypothetical protein
MPETCEQKGDEKSVALGGKVLFLEEEIGETVQCCVWCVSHCSLGEKAKMLQDEIEVQDSAVQCSAVQFFCVCGVMCVWCVCGAPCVVRCMCNSRVSRRVPLLSSRSQDR